MLEAKRPSDTHLDITIVTLAERTLTRRVSKCKRHIYHLGYSNTQIEVQYNTFTADHDTDHDHNARTDVSK